MCSQQIVTFQNVLDIVESLPESQQKSLIDIVYRRLIEHRRNLLAENIKEAREEYACGKTKEGSVEELPFYKSEEDITMKAYEYYADILADGHLSVPVKLKEVLQPDSKVRVMLLLEDEGTEWKKFTMTQFLKGYSEGDEIYDKL